MINKIYNIMLCGQGIVHCICAGTFYNLIPFPIQSNSPHYTMFTSSSVWLLGGDGCISILNQTLLNLRRIIVVSFGIISGVLPKHNSLFNKRNGMALLRITLQIIIYAFLFKLTLSLWRLHDLFVHEFDLSFLFIGLLSDSGLVNNFCE